MSLNREYTTPVSPALNKIYSISGEICFEYTKKTLFKVARITYELFEDESYQYIFEPYYDVIDGLEHVDWGGIPGIEMTNRQKQYYRTSMIPVFISERTPSANRVNLQEELREANLEYLDRLEWLINTDTVYSGDSLVVKKDGFNSFSGISKRSAQWHALSILQLLGMRQPIEIDGKLFKDSDRSLLIKTFLIEYEFLSTKRKENQNIGQLQAKEKGIYTGRKPIKVPLPLLDEVRKKLSSGQITLHEALHITNLSKATLYRKFKKLEESQK
ncbi:MAG: recombinase family protein [Sphaerochaeta sp.]|nr:recombinase family protein [Sphaerochaeta sp.]